MVPYYVQMAVPAPLATAADYMQHNRLARGLTFGVVGVLAATLLIAIVRVIQKHNSKPAVRQRKVRASLCAARVFNSLFQSPSSLLHSS